MEEQVLTRFEEENGGDIVRATLCLLETSRHGLLETELLQMLADEMLITPKKFDKDNKAAGVADEGDGIIIITNTCWY